MGEVVYGREKLAAEQVAGRSEHDQRGGVNRRTLQALHEHVRGGQPVLDQDIHATPSACRVLLPTDELMVPAAQTPTAAPDGAACRRELNFVSMLM